MRLSQMSGAAILICLATVLCPAQSVQEQSLCKLQERVAPGAHIQVRISGIYSAGPENSTLDDQACPFTPYKSTWVEFDLKVKHNDKKMRKLLDHSQQIYLQVEGEFYGPPTPDPNLPKGAGSAFPPHWGHLGCCRTKLVIHIIRKVKPVPKDRAEGEAKIGEKIVPKAV